MTAPRPESVPPALPDTRARLVLAVPALEALLAEAAHPPAVVTRILARSRKHAAGSDPVVAEALGLNPVPAPAALSRLAVPDSGPEPDPQAIWMCADVVALVPDLTAVWVRGPAQLPEASRQDIEAGLEELFAQEGLEYFAGNGSHAHLRLPRIPDCQFQPPGRIAGRRLDEVLPRGPDEKLWRRLINECQMLMHSFSRNSSAAESGGLGLWFWGAGRLGPAPSRRPELTVDPSGDPVFEGLARRLGARIRTMPEWRPGPGTRVVHWPAEAGRDADTHLQDLARHWLMPAWKAVRYCRLRTLILAGDRGWWDLTPGASWAFWRSRTPGVDTEA